MIATVVKSRLEIHDDGKCIASFKPLDDSLPKWLRENHVHSILCSSSVDFPEDDGLPGVNVRLWIDQAFTDAWK